MKTPIKIYLDGTQFEALKLLAAQERTTFSSILRNACSRFVENPRLIPVVLDVSMNSVDPQGEIKTSMLALEKEDIDGLDKLSVLTGISRSRIIGLALTGILKGIIK